MIEINCVKATKASTNLCWKTCMSRAPFGRLWVPDPKRSLTDWLNWAAPGPVNEKLRYWAFCCISKKRKTWIIIHSCSWQIELIYSAGSRPLLFEFRLKPSIYWNGELLRREPFDHPQALHLFAFPWQLSFHLFSWCNRSSAELPWYDWNFLQTACFVSNDSAKKFYPCDLMSDSAPEIDEIQSKKFSKMSSNLTCWLPQ